LLQAARKIITAPKQKAAVAAVPTQKEWVGINFNKPMKRSNRKFVLHLKPGQMSEQAREKELGWLDDLLQFAESPEIFCQTHELAGRNRITHKTNKLLNIYSNATLKPFRFLICKN
jgi:hypothetical protein